MHGLCYFWGDKHLVCLKVWKALHLICCLEKCNGGVHSQLLHGLVCIVEIEGAPRQDEEERHYVILPAPALHHQRTTCQGTIKTQVNKRVVLLLVKPMNRTNRLATSARVYFSVLTWYCETYLQPLRLSRRLPRPASLSTHSHDGITGS